MPRRGGRFLPRFSFSFIHFFLNLLSYVFLDFAFLGEGLGLGLRVRSFCVVEMGV